MTHPRARWLKRHGFTNGLWRLEERDKARREVKARSEMVSPMPDRCSDCGWALPRFGCPHKDCNGVALHTRRTT